MSGLRVLVGCKRVIDYAVKVRYARSTVDAENGAEMVFPFNDHQGECRA